MNSLIQELIGMYYQNYASSRSQGFDMSNNVAYCTMYCGPTTNLICRELCIVVFKEALTSATFHDNDQVH